MGTLLGRGGQTALAAQSGSFRLFHQIPRFIGKNQQHEGNHDPKYYRDVCVPSLDPNIETVKNRTGIRTWLATKTVWPQTVVILGPIPVRPTPYSSGR